jgi:hypothetical protein
VPTDGRSNLLLPAIQRAADISILCDLVRSLAGDRHPDGAQSERESAAFGDSTDIIRDELLARVRALAATNQIWIQAQPAHVIWFWWGAIWKVKSEPSRIKQ